MVDESIYKDETVFCLSCTSVQWCLPWSSLLRQPWSSV